MLNKYDLLSSTNETLSTSKGNVVRRLDRKYRRLMKKNRYFDTLSQIPVIKENSKIIENMVIWFFD